MWQQKILALAHRLQPQARDIFDLYLLLGQQPKKMTGITIDALEQAKNNAKALSYDEYKSQVVAYLLPEYQTQFGSVDVWQQITQDVIASLEQHNEAD